MDAMQQAVWQQKVALLRQYRPPQWMHLDPSRAPSDSRPFIVTSVPFPAYPPANAPAVNLFASDFVVPVGFTAIINKLAIVHVGGGFVDGTGIIIWRVLRNSAGEKGLNNLTAQVGSLQIPNDILLVLQEGDRFQITVQTTALQAGTTGARISGYFVPVLKRLT